MLDREVRIKFGTIAAGTGLFPQRINFISGDAII